MKIFLRIMLNSQYCTDVKFSKSLFSGFLISFTPEDFQKQDANFRPAPPLDFIQPPYFWHLLLPIQLTQLHLQCYFSQL